MGNTPSAPGGGAQARSRARTQPPRPRSREPSLVPDVSRTRCEVVHAATSSATKRTWQVPQDAKVYEFPAPWCIGRVSAEKFAGTMADAKLKFVKGPTVVIYFRVSKTQCVRREYSSASGFTLAKLLNNVYSVALSAAVLTLRDAGKGGSVCKSEVDALYRDKHIRQMYITPSRIYVNAVDNVAKRRRP